MIGFPIFTSIVVLPPHAPTPVVHAHGLHLVSEAKEIVAIGKVVNATFQLLQLIFPPPAADQAPLRPHSWYQQACVET